MSTLIASTAALLMFAGLGADSGAGVYHTAAQQMVAAGGPAGDVQSCVNCGTVTAIEPVTGSGESHGGGAVIGAVIGGVIGHQFGSGKGNDAATAGGAIAGGVAGNEVEKRRNRESYYKVTVTMTTGGGMKVVNVRDLGGLAVGDKVRVSGDNLERL